MNRKKIKNIVVTTLVICIFSVMTVFAVTYTIADPIITSTTSASKINMKIDMSMNAVPDACLLLNVTPYYRMRGSADLYIEPTKEISSYSGRVTQLKGSVNYIYNVDSNRTYIRCEQKGYALISGTYNKVAEKITVIN